MGLFILVLIGWIVLWFLGYILIHVATRVLRYTGLYSRRPVRIILQGLLGLSILLTLIQTGSWADDFIHRSDRQAIDRAYSRFHLALNGGRYEDAFEYMAADYRSRYSLEEFVLKFRDLGQPSLLLDPRRGLSVNGTTAWLFPGDATSILSGGPNCEFVLSSGPDYEFVKIGEEWYLTGELTWSVD